MNVSIEHCKEYIEEKCLWCSYGYETSDDSLECYVVGSANGSGSLRS